jgi:hypothetical protein
VSSPVPVEDDLDLETRIDNAALCLATAKDREQRIFWRDALTRLVNQRTAERVAQMEAERGLAR